MSYRGSIFFRILAALLIAGLLVAAGISLYRAGFTQGYVQGASISQGTSPVQSAPVAPFYPGYGPWYGFGFWHPFGFLPLIPLAFFFLFLLFALGFWFRPRRWAAYGHPHEHHHGWRERPEQTDRPKSENPDQPESNP